MADDARSKTDETALALIDMVVPPECLPGVRANLAVLAGHLAIVRAADVPGATEAAEVFRA